MGDEKLVIGSLRDRNMCVFLDIPQVLQALENGSSDLFRSHSGDFLIPKTVKPGLILWISDVQTGLKIWERPRAGHQRAPTSLTTIGDAWNENDQGGAAEDVWLHTCTQPSEEAKCPMCDSINQRGFLFTCKCACPLDQSAALRLRDAVRKRKGIEKGKRAT